MNKKFKILYYFLVALFTLVFTYQVYQLVFLIMDKPDKEAHSISSEDE